jgi:transposase InsO family protein
MKNKTRISVPLKGFGTDTSFISTTSDSAIRFLYICGLVDLCSGFIFSPEVSTKNDKVLSLKSYENTPLSLTAFVHSDHGSNLLCNDILELLKSKGAIVPLGRRGKSLDNREIEFT